MMIFRFWEVGMPKREQRWSRVRAPVGHQFNEDAVIALETVHALIDGLIATGALARDHASKIEEQASRQIQMRAMEAEARAMRADEQDQTRGPGHYR